MRRNGEKMKEEDPCARLTYVGGVRARARALGSHVTIFGIRIRPLRMSVMISTSVIHCLWRLEGMK